MTDPKEQQHLPRVIVFKTIGGYRAHALHGDRRECAEDEIYLSEKEHQATVAAYEAKLAKIKAGLEITHRHFVHDNILQLGASIESLLKELE